MSTVQAMITMAENNARAVDDATLSLWQTSSVPGIRSIANAEVDRRAHAPSAERIARATATVPMLPGYPANPRGPIGRRIAARYAAGQTVLDRQMRLAQCACESPICPRPHA